MVCMGNSVRRMGLVGSWIAALAACGDGAPDNYMPPSDDEDDSGSPTQPAVLDLSGTYSCTFETIDNDVFCGGPVYLSHLQGQGITMTLTQSDRELELGLWGVILDGHLSGAQVTAKYVD